MHNYVTVWLTDDGFCSAGRRNAIDLFDNLAIALVFTLYMIGLYRRRQRRQIVRQLAAAPLDQSQRQ